MTLFAGTPAAQTVAPGRIVTINRDVVVDASDNTPVNTASFDTPQGIFITGQGVFVIETKGGPAFHARRTGVVRFINTSPTSVTFYPGAAQPISVQPGYARVIAGGGDFQAEGGDGGFARNAGLLAPSDPVVHPATGDLYIAEVGRQAVRKVNGATGVVSRLNLPVFSSTAYTGLGMGADGRVYIANFGRSLVLRETSTGSGAFATMNTGTVPRPRDIAVDSAGNAYVTAEGGGFSGERKIVKIEANGAVTTLAGAAPGFEGDGGPAIDAKLALSPPYLRRGAERRRRRRPVEAGWGRRRRRTGLLRARPAERLRIICASSQKNAFLSHAS